MTEATKSSPAPLDAYETAKPLEPIWTVQGGDPLGAPLLRIWAHFARIQAGVITSGTLDSWFEQILRAANDHPPKNDNEREDFLNRATQTESISWRMDAYLRGEDREAVVVKHQTAMERMDIHDARRKCAERISAALSEIEDFREILSNFGYMYESLDCAMFSVIEDLRSLGKVIDIRKKP